MYFILLSFFCRCNDSLMFSFLALLLIHCNLNSESKNIAISCMSDPIGNELKSEASVSSHTIPWNLNLTDSVSDLEQREYEYKYSASKYKYNYYYYYYY